MSSRRTFDCQQFGQCLLQWFDTCRRDLPWRHSHDPYGIWVSEVMLQQTQVSRVYHYWPRFMERFPTVVALAAAAEQDILAAWSGLGYYRRARLLHAAARQVVEQHGGRLPADLAALRALPGMGAYTAAAVGSIALGLPEPVVDANVIRVSCRLDMLAGDPAASVVQQQIRRRLLGLIPPDRPGDFNQAMMELGALLCSPLGPECRLCPVADFCQARSWGCQEDFPQQKVRLTPVRFREAIGIVISAGQVLLTRREHARGWWPGLWRLPRWLLPGGASPLRKLAQWMSADFGLPVTNCAADGQISYCVTRYRIEAQLLTCRASDRVVIPDCRWLPAGELETIALPAPDRRALVQFAADSAE